MGIAWKLVVGLVLLLPMTAYVVGSLVAAAEEPRQHDPIIIEERSQAPDKSGKPSSAKPTDKPSEDESDDHGRNRGRGGDDDKPEIITPSPSVMDDDDDDEFDDHGGNSGRGGGDDSDDDDNSGKGSDDD